MPLTATHSNTLYFHYAVQYVSHQLNLVDLKPGLLCNAHDIQTVYLLSYFTRATDVPSRQRLRSASSNQLAVPQFNLSTAGNGLFQFLVPTSGTAFHLLGHLHHRSRCSDSVLRHISFTCHIRTWFSDFRPLHCGPCGHFVIQATLKIQMMMMMVMMMTNYLWIWRKQSWCGRFGSWCIISCPVRASWLLITINIAHISWLTMLFSLIRSVRRFTGTSVVTLHW